MFLFVFGFCILSVQAQTYYIDSKTGSDDHSGLSEKQAWKSLEKLNKHEFKAGHKVLFKAGTEYIGQFEPKGSGSKEAPVIIGKYGKGAKPILHGKGKKQHTVLLQNVQYWEVSDLEITNQGEKFDPGRNGVILFMWNMGDVHHIHLKNLTVRDVNGTVVKNDGAGNGISFVNGGDKIPTRYIDLLIEGCHIYNCQRNGITGKGNTDRNKWFPSLNVVFRKNLIEGVPGDGIVPIGCDGALVEYNIVRNSPDLLPIQDAAAGIWPWGCDNTIIQYNEVSGQNAKWDGQGFDSDYNCRNTIIQYNYSHDNAGGFVMVCNEGNTLGEPYNIGTENTIIRHNVSINDGLRAYPTRPGWFSPTIHISGPAKNTRIENNTMFIFKKPLADIDKTVLMADNWGGPWPVDLSFINNTFYVYNDSAEYKFELGKTINAKFEGNVYHGNFKNKPMDATAKVSPPNLMKDLKFHEKFPKSLRKSVLKRLKELEK